MPGKENPMRMPSHAVVEVLARGVWDVMKSREMTFAEMISVCAVLLINVAEKCDATEDQILAMARKVMVSGRRRGAHATGGATAHIEPLPNDKSSDRA